MSQEGFPAMARRAPLKKVSLSGRFRHEFFEDLEFLLGQMPGSAGRYLRAFYYRWRMEHLGARAKINVGIEVREPERIRIGDDFLTLRNCLLCAESGGRIEIGHGVGFATNVVVNAGVEGTIRIGHFVRIANNSVLRTSPHRYDDPDVPIIFQGHKPGSIVIEDDVWIAANVTILPNTHIERGCVVAAGSVVGGRISAYSIVAGNPARVVGRRGEKLLHAAQGSH